MKKLLTIGMATHTDFHGTYFTVQALRMYHAEAMKECEIVVVDNSPASAHGPPVKGIIDSAKGGGMQAKYVDMLSPLGTSVSRDRIFKEAEGEYVMVMDCHVLIVPGALDRLLKFLKGLKGIEKDHIYSGPLIHDSFSTYGTQFNDVWRAQMWGVWGVTWECKCGQGQNFTILEQEAMAVPHNVPVHTPFKCRRCGQTPPTLAYAGHEAALSKMGYRSLGMRDDDAPFEIPGMGLGLFLARRESWLGFHPDARGFGGEELYIHGKYRAKGRKAMCLPFLKWDHRFARPDGVAYPLQNWLKARNYILEFKEMGWSLDPVFQQFVETELIKKADWDALVNDPIAIMEPPAEVCIPCGANKPIEQKFTSVDVVYDQCVNIERDLNQHMHILKQVAEKSESVTEFSGRRESFIAFLAGKPKRVVSYNIENDALFIAAMQLAQENGMSIQHDKTMGEGVNRIEKTDALFLDTEHTYARVREELRKFGNDANKYIVLHDTEIFGMQGTDGHQGILYAISWFLSENPEWGISLHVPVQYGLTILARNEEHYAEAVPIKLPMLDMGVEMPGTILKRHLASINIHPPDTCDCAAAAALMDVWGVQGCVLHRDWLVDKMKKRSKDWGWTGFLSAAAAAVKNGLAFKLNPLDPIGSLVDQSIKEAKKGMA